MFGKDQAVRDVACMRPIVGMDDAPPPRAMAHLLPGSPLPPDAGGVQAAAPVGTTARRLLMLWTPEGLVMTIALAVAFAALYFRWFYAQHLHSWRYFQDWGHAYLIPLLSLYLVWRQRRALAALTPQTFWPALAPLLLGVVSYVLFVGTRFTGGHMIQGLAMILTLFGVVLLVLGPRYMEHLFVPIGFLVFGVTVSEMVMVRLTAPLQEIAAQGAYVVLALAAALGGFGVDISGVQLVVHTSQGRPVPLNIAETCSGMRMVVAFFALGAATAVLGCPLWWQRVALLLLAAPVAIVVNIGRVAVLGLLSLANPELATGEAHMLVGELLLIPGLMLFLGVVWVLRRLSTGDDLAGPTTLDGRRQE